MKVPFLDLKQQYRQIEHEVLPRLSTILENTSYIMGPEVKEFDRSFAKYCGVNHAVSVANGTDAIILALKALGIGAGDEVITAANTFIATLEGIAHVRAKPVLVEYDPQTYTLDPNQLEEAYTRQTRAVIAVHLYGRPTDMDRINAWARKKGIFVLEDAAQAQGATYKGHRAGSLADVACFSFYPGKNLGAYGDAGAIATNHPDVYERLIRLRDHGSVRKYEHELIGYNSRLDSLQAAVLNVKLAYLDGWNEQRRDRAKLYRSLLAQVPGLVLPPQDDADYQSVHHLFVIQTPQGQRDALKAHLDSKGIGTGIHYPIPVHLSQAFAHLGYPRGTFPVTEVAAERLLSLPMFAELTEEQVVYVAESIAEFARVA